MSLFLKAKIHVRLFVDNKNIKYSIYNFLLMTNRHLPFKSFVRRFLIKQPLLLRNICATEKHLERYMIPKHNGCCIDVGANVGLWTFYLASKGLFVYAFEPNPNVFHVLMEQSDKLWNVNVFDCALGEKESVTSFNVHYLSGHSSIVSKEEDFAYTVNVPIRTLDSFNFENVGLIKIDTEGYEVQVLLGAIKTISVNKPRLIIEVHKPFNEQKEKIENVLKLLGYKYVVRYKSVVNSQPHIIADSLGDADFG